MGYYTSVLSALLPPRCSAMMKKLLLHQRTTLDNLRQEIDKLTAVAVSWQKTNPTPSRLDHHTRYCHTLSTYYRRNREGGGTEPHGNDLLRAAGANKGRSVDAAAMGRPSHCSTPTPATTTETRHIRPQKKKNFLTTTSWRPKPTYFHLRKVSRIQPPQYNTKQSFHKSRRRKRTFSAAFILFVFLFF